MARLMTPSRSRKTAVRCIGFSLELAHLRVAQQRGHGNAQGLPGGALATPAEAPDAIRVEAYYGNVALPAAVATAIFEVHTAGLKTRNVHCKVRDLLHGNVVPGGYVEHFEGLLARCMRQQ